MPSLCLDRLRSGGLITNYHCSSACAHCVYRSSPRREPAYITPEQAATACRCVRRLGCRALHIGGGEPFLQPDGLAAVLEAAAAEGVAIDYIETNASWCRDETAAVARLRSLRARGGGTLLISIDPFHNAFIPLARVKTLMRACRQAGMEVFPWRLEFYAEIDRFDDQRPHALAEYEAAYGPDYLADLERRYGLNLGGRALQTFAPRHPQVPLEPLLEAGSHGCQALVNGNHFHVDLHGDFIPTRCPGLAVALADLGRPLDPARYPALTTLFTGGPAALCHQAQERGFVPRPSYASPCELCDQTRAFLARQVPDDFPDLRPREFYTVDADSP